MTTHTAIAAVAEGGGDSASDPKKQKKKRVSINRPKDRSGPFARLRGVFDQPVLWDHAATIPTQSEEGARRKLPTIFYTAMPCFAAIWRSFSLAETNLNEEPTWTFLCELLCKLQSVYRPDDEPFDLAVLLSTKPLTAQNYFDARRSWLADHLDSIEHMYEEAAAKAAREVDLADPNGAGSYNNLTRERTAISDGKVTREPGSRYRTLLPHETKPLLKITVETHVVDTHARKADGEPTIIAIRDMEGDAHLYMTGNRPVIGFKTVRWELRSNDTNTTIVLAVRRPRSKDEAGCAVEAGADIKARLPGLLAVSYDAALRGTHIGRLGRVGMVGISPMVAAENVDGKPRVEKTGKVAIFKHSRSDSVSCSHEFHHRAGQLCEAQIDAAGKRTLVGYPDPTIQARPNKVGFRMYHQWDVTCSAGLPIGARPMKVGVLRWSITDENPDFNVAENLRAYPPAGPGYEAPHGWRQSIENNNHQSDAVKVQSRGRSSRAQWNHINEIGWSIMINGIAIQRHRAKKRGATSPPTRAALQAA